MKYPLSRRFLKTSVTNSQPAGWVLYGQWDFQGNLWDSSGNGRHAQIVSGSNSTISPQYLDCGNGGVEIFNVVWNTIYQYKWELEVFFPVAPNQWARWISNGGDSFFTGLNVGTSDFPYQKPNDTYAFRTTPLPFTRLNNTWYKIAVTATNEEGVVYPFNCKITDLNTGIVVMDSTHNVNITGFRVGMDNASVSRIDYNTFRVGIGFRYGAGSRPSNMRVRNLKMWIYNK